jgi:DNA (cytosine-5)-methyltransferase 1
MKYFSTFSGIGGFELGIKQAYDNLDNRRITGTSILEERRDKSLSNDSNGARWGTNPTCIGYSEVDKYAVSIYQKHFPNHINYGDITKINADTLPDFDLLVGGFPCQAFSIAGKRKGFEDTRGTLFFDLARILRAKQPRLFVFENVKGLLSHDNGKTFRTIIGSLDELGYDCEWQVLNSKNHGVPQNRERVFIVGHLRGTGRRQVFPLGGDGKETNAELQELTTGVSDALRIYNVGKVSKGISGQVDSPQGIARTLKGLGGGLGAKTGLYAIKKDHDELVKTKDEALCIDKSYHKGFDNHGQRTGVSDGLRIRRLTPTECERLQGFSDGWTEGLSDTQRYKTLGNAVTTNVVRAVIEKLL